MENKINKRKIRQELTGRVVSSTMKTISVEIYRLSKVKKYAKYTRKKSVFKAHDEKNQAKVGDTVKIFEVRPISKTKRWRLDQIIQSGDVLS